MTSEPFLYADRRFRVIGEPRVALPAPARVALAEAHRGLAEHPDACVVACPCGAQDDQRVSIGDRHGLPLSLVLCRRCGIIRANPRPSAARLTWFYSSVYRRLYGPFGPTDDALFQSKLWKGALVQRALAAAQARLPEGPIVDLGCGGGWTLAPLADGGRARVGFDFDERLLTLGRSRGLDLRLGGVERARRDGLRASLLIFGHVLEHTLDPEAELREITSLLAPGGFLYVEVPHTRRIGGTLLQNDSSRYWQRAHLWDFQREHVRTLAQRAGYDVVWESEDSDSVFLLCQAAQPASATSFPSLGARVQRQLLRFEALHQSRPRRLLAAARKAYQKSAGALQRPLRSRARMR